MHAHIVAKLARERDKEEELILAYKKTAEEAWDGSWGTSGRHINARSYPLDNKSSAVPVRFCRLAFLAVAACLRFLSCCTRTHSQPQPPLNMSDENSYPRRGSSDSIHMGKPQLTQTVSNAYTISPELFEKLYLTPKVPRVGDNAKRYANATPLGFVGFVISTMTFSMVLMGWGGADGESAIAGMFLFVGPLLLVLTTIFEWM